MPHALPFLFMGCWNRQGLARDRVLDAICADPIPRIVLAGDNIYPTKTTGSNGKKHKYYDPAVLEFGIKGLQCKQVLGTALGNHNVADPVILTKELDAWSVADREFDDIVLIFLDSNLTDPDSMLGSLESKLAKISKPYYLIIHEPLVAFKKNKIHQLLFLIPLLEVLIRRPPLAILCADTHHYQHGILTYKDVSIPQYIVGTGGAEPDSMDATTESIHIDDVTYTRKDFIPGYGYAVVDASGVKFVKVLDWIHGGGVRKSKRNKHKRNLKSTTRKTRK